MSTQQLATSVLDLIVPPTLIASGPLDLSCIPEAYRPFRPYALPALRRLYLPEPDVKLTDKLSELETQLLDARANQMDLHGEILSRDRLIESLSDREAEIKRRHTEEFKTERKRWENMLVDQDLWFERERKWAREQREDLSRELKQASEQIPVLQDEVNALRREITRLEDLLVQKGSHVLVDSPASPTSSSGHCTSEPSSPSADFSLETSLTSSSHNLESALPLSVSCFGAASEPSRPFVFHAPLIDFSKPGRQHTITNAESIVSDA